MSDIGALGIGTIIAAIFGYVGIKAVTISNHRQAWINSLRDDIVTYLREIEVMHYRVARLSGTRGHPVVDDLDKQQDARNACLFAYRRVLLRLNLVEPPHIELATRLKELQTVVNTVADAERIDAAIVLARQVLKDEWAVTKYGIFTTPTLIFKKWWRRRFGLPVRASTI